MSESWVRAPAAIALLAVLLPCLPTVAFAADDQRDKPVEVTQAGPILEGVQTVLEDARALVTAPLRMDRRDALITVGSLALVGGLFAADKPILRMVQRNTNQTGLDVADGFSAAGSAGALVGFNAGLIGIGYLQESYGQGSRLKEAGLVSLEAEAFAVAATFALKAVTGRARPEDNKGVTHFRPFSGGGSFASTHAAASFAVASVLADRFDQPVGLLAYGFATAVAASRVYTKDHFASDVVAGSLIGWGLGTFLSRRHAEYDSTWRLEPVIMRQGLDVGLMVGKRF